MASSEYTTEQMDEVCFWVHDERRCVTTQTISLTFGLSLDAASLIIKELPRYSKKDGATRTYEFTKCQWVHGKSKKGIQRSVMNLVKSHLTFPDHETDQRDEDENAIYYSIALKTTGDQQSSTLRTAHEMDMALLRDQVRNEERGESDSAHALDPSIQSSLILPTIVEQIDRLDIRTAREMRASGGRPQKKPKIGSTTLPSSASLSSSNAKPRQATDASNFFAKAKTTAPIASPTLNSSSRPRSDEKSASKTRADANAKFFGKSKVTTSTKASSTKINSSGHSDKKNESSESIANGRTADVGVRGEGDKKTSSRSRKSPELTMTVVSTKTQNGTKQAEKENKPTASIGGSRGEKAAIGNADDFVGDEDEDDEFEVAEKERKRRNVQARKQAAKKEEEQKAAVAARKQQVAAATREASSQDGDVVNGVKPGGKGRRKKLVDKTFVDSQGYLKTEAQWEWEEVPSDEEKLESEAVKVMTEVKKKSNPVKNSKTMKQGNLMGFFKKK